MYSTPGRLRNNLRKETRKHAGNSLECDGATVSIPSVDPFSPRQLSIVQALPHDLLLKTARTERPKVNLSPKAGRAGGEKE